MHMHTEGRKEGLAKRSLGCWDPATVHEEGEEQDLPEGARAGLNAVCDDEVLVDEHDRRAVVHQRATARYVGIHLDERPARSTNSRTKTVKSRSAYLIAVAFVCAA